MLRYRTFPTTADLGVFVYGKSPEEVFENLAYALRKIVGGNKKLAGSGEKTIKLDFPSLEMGFFLWASELLFLYDTEKILPSRARVRLSSTDLQARVLEGKLLSPPQVYIKAVTMHRLSFMKIKGRWRASLVFDL